MRIQNPLFLAALLLPTLAHAAPERFLHCWEAGSDAKGAGVHVQVYGTPGEEMRDARLETRGESAKARSLGKYGVVATLPGVNPTGMGDIRRLDNNDDDNGFSLEIQIKRVNEDGSYPAELEAAVLKRRGRIRMNCDTDGSYSAFNADYYKKVFGL